MVLYTIDIRHLIQFAWLAEIGVKLRCGISGLLMVWQVHMWSVTQKSFYACKDAVIDFSSLFAECCMSTIISRVKASLVDLELDYS